MIALLFILFIIYWYIAFAIQVGVELVCDSKRDIKYIIAESIFIGWLFLPIEIGLLIGYLLNKIK